MTVNGYLQPNPKEEEMNASEKGKISLRPFVLSDVDDFMVWASDDQVSHFCSWDTYTSKEDLLRYMKDVVLPHPWFRAICLDGRPVGAVSVTQSPDSKCRGELGYVVASGYWRRGIASAAARMVMSSVFKELTHMERLEALVDVENEGSQKVLEKVGFHREGVLRKYWHAKGRTRDMVMYSFIPGDEVDGCLLDK